MFAENEEIVLEQLQQLRTNRYQEVWLTICGLVRLRKVSLILEIVKTPFPTSKIEIIKHCSFGQDLYLASSNTE